MPSVDPPAAAASPVEAWRRPLTRFPGTVASVQVRPSRVRPTKTKGGPLSKPPLVAQAAAGLIAMASALPAAAQEAARPAPGPLTIETQGSFFVGGRDLRSDTLSTLPAYAPTGTITVDQALTGRPQPRPRASVAPLHPSGAHRGSPPR